MRTVILAHEAARDLAKKIIDDTPLDGKMKVEIKKVTSKRSIAQNNLYQVWARCMAEDLGYTHKEMKTVLVQEHLTPTIITDLKGKDIQVWPSTTDIGVKGFAEFLTMIEIQAADIGIRLDKSSDEYYMAMGERQ